ncbi:MAG: glycosyltransferase family 2 protein [Candidatus Komeilibacteria bacterium]|nr:glycosyltransferase family 2 protein [Candidatus Komeilibacteria bacterium]
METRVAVILPAYNEAKHIQPVLESLTAHPGVRDMRVVVIDDGSTDDTASTVRSFANIILLQHGRNRGLGHTFRTAVDYCLQERVTCMIFFDADGQFSVEDIPRVAAPVLAGTADFALGSRFLHGIPKDMPVAKVWGNRMLARFMSRVTRTTIRDVACGFRAYGREALLRTTLNGSFTYTQEVILDLLFKGLRCVEVPVTVKYFEDRESTISSNLWWYGFRVFGILMRTIRDYRPLAFFGYVGGMLFVVGLVLDGWLLQYYFFTGSFSPYKIIGFAGAFCNFLGLTIIFIGLVAEMLNRIRSEQEESLYLIKKMRYQ